MTFCQTVVKNTFIADLDLTFNLTLELLFISDAEVLKDGAR